MLSGFSCLELCALNVGLRYEYENFDTHRYRFLCREENLLLLLKGSITDAQLTLPATGCSSPFFLAGPFTQYGLFKAMDNISCYSADSSFFREKTVFKADTAMTVSRRSVLAFNPLPGVWSLYGIKTQDRNMRIGSFLSFSLPEWLLLETAADYTLPAGSTEQPLMHIAGKLGYADKSLCLSLSSVLSVSPVLVPGHTMRLAAFLASKHIHPGFALWYSSPEYINPQGKSSPTLFRGEGLLELLPCTGINIRTICGIRIDNPGEPPGAYLPSREYFSLETGYSRKLQTDMLFTVKSRLEKEQKYSPEGKINDKYALSCSGTFSTGALSASLLMETEKKSGKIPVCTICPGVSFRVRGIKLDLEFQWQCSDPAGWGCSMKAAFYHEKYTLDLKLATRKPVSIEQRDNTDAPVAWADLLNGKITWTAATGN